jgi:hypothetical protein
VIDSVVIDASGENGDLNCLGSNAGDLKAAGVSCALLSVTCSIDETSAQRALERRLYQWIGWAPQSVTTGELEPL